jgi:hypothetical protein
MVNADRVGKSKPLSKSDQAIIFVEFFMVHVLP